MHDLIQSFDNSILGILNSYATHNAVADRLIKGLTDTALVKGTVFLCVFWWIWFRGAAVGVREQNRQFVLRSMAGVFVVTAVCRLVQHIVQQSPRPIDNPGSTFNIPSGELPGKLVDYSSFPSDHAVLFFGLSMALTLWSRALGAFAFIWTTVIICLPRIYMGYHYPSDIAAGAVIGILVMAAVQYVPVPRWAFTTVARWEVTYRPLFYALAFLATYEVASLFDDVRMAVWTVYSG